MPRLLFLLCGTFLSIYAAYKFVKSDKYRIIKSFIIILIAIFCYNGIISVFIVTVSLLLLINKNNSKKPILKNILIAGVLGIIVIMLNYIQVRIVSNYLNIEISRIHFDLVPNIMYTITHVGLILTSEKTQLFPKYLFLIFLGIICAVTIYKLIKEKDFSFLGRFIILLLISLFTPFGINIFSLSSFGAGRLCMPIGMTIGYLYLMLYIKNNSELLKKKDVISCFLNGMLFIYLLTNIINFYSITQDHLTVNKMDKDMTYEIAMYLEEYEKENNIKVEYIAMKLIPKVNYRGYYKSINTLTSRAIYSESSYDGIINFYTGRSLKRTALTKEMNQKYVDAVKDEYKAICIDNVLICPVYNI